MVHSGVLSPRIHVIRAGKLFLEAKDTEHTLFPETLESALKDPVVAGADQLMLQVGKPLFIMNSLGQVQGSGDPLPATDVERLIMSMAPPHAKTALQTQPSVQFQHTFPNGAQYEVKVGRDASGYKAILKKSQAATHIPGANPPLPQHAHAAGAGGAAAAPAMSAVPASPAPPAAKRAIGDFQIDRYFQMQLDAKASDMHLSSCVLPMLRKDGEMMPIVGFDQPSTPEQVEKLLWEMMPDKNREEFLKRHDTDFAYEYGTEARFRCNVFMDRKGMGGVFRVIPSKILTAEQLGLSRDILKLCYLTKGLVLVTGPTGSGKSTTLCAMIDYINRNRTDHIITIEDPIEFVHENQKCLINQREIHNHTDSFKNALRAALREDPDIILVGEMRDLETIAIAIEMAETGHLVFGTLHTSTAPSTVDRIIDQFPADQQSQIRVMLGESLKGVIAQTLCKKIGGGRIAALEVLLTDAAMANLIREGKTMQIPSSMQTGKGKGNVLLNDALIEMVKKKLVEPQEAYVKAVDKPTFENLLKREGIKTDFITPQVQAGGAAS